MSSDCLGLAPANPPVTDQKSTNDGADRITGGLFCIRHGYNPAKR